jgi:hypothetical protein
VIVVCLPWLLFLGACKKREPASPPVPARPTRSQPPIPPPPPPPPGVDSPEVTELLTEDKLKRFLTYQKELVAPPPAEATPGTAAAQKTGTYSKKPAEAAVPRDDRAARVAAGLKKSGLSQDEAAKLSRLLVPYYARVATMQDAMKRSEAARLRLEEAKKAGKEPNPVDKAMEKALGDQSRRIEAVRTEFASRYGAERFALLQKHEADFLPIQLKMMNAAMGGMRMPGPPPVPPPASPGSGQPPAR